MKLEITDFIYYDNNTHFQGLEECDKLITHSKECMALVRINNLKAS